MILWRMCLCVYLSIFLVDAHDTYVYFWNYFQVHFCEFLCIFVCIFRSIDDNNVDNNNVADRVMYNLFDDLQMYVFDVYLYIFEKYTKL